MASMFKEFVTEKEIEEVKKKRQEEWEKVRRPDQPLGRQSSGCFVTILCTHADFVHEAYTVTV